MSFGPGCGPLASLEAQRCHGHGICSNLTQAGPNQCACDLFYYSSTQCDRSLFSVTGNAHLAYSIISIIILFLLIVWIMFEFLLDLRYARFSFKSPTILAKGNLALICLVSLIAAGLEIKNCLDTSVVSNAVVIDYLGIIAFLLLCVQFNLVIVKWITILVRAKTLGSHNLSRLRIVLLASCSIIIVTFFILLGLRAARVGGGIMGLVIFWLITAYCIFISFVGIFYLVKLSIWVKKHKKEEIMKKVGRKNNLLIAQIADILISLTIGTTMAYSPPSFWLSFANAIVIRVSMTTGVVLYILFLENYLRLFSSPFSAYWRALTGEDLSEFVALSKSTLDATRTAKSSTTPPDKSRRLSTVSTISPTTTTSVTSNESAATSD